MAYFPNGTSGLAWQEENCFNGCMFWDDSAEFVCPVWEAHQIFNYNESEKIQDILNMLIPMDENGIFPLKCAMYRKAE